MELIEKQQAIDVLKELTANGTNKGMISGEDAVHRIEMLPSAQHEIIHCQNCKFYQSNHHWCELLESEFSLTDFCSYGEGRTE